MKEIPLTKGQVALVDDEDYEYLMQWKWCARWAENVGDYYAVRSEGKREVEERTGIPYHWRTNQGRLVMMHRVVSERAGYGIDSRVGVGGPSPDHINHRTLDNRRCNLRASNPSQQRAHTRMSRANRSGYKGVIWHKRERRWMAYIKHHKQIHLGYFTSASEAARAYDRKALELFGEFAVTNASLGLLPVSEVTAAA